MRWLIRKGVPELLDHPAGRRALRHIEVKDASSSMVDREPDVEKLKPDRRHDEEVHPDDQVAVVPEEGRPALLTSSIGLGLGEIS